MSTELLPCPFCGSKRIGWCSEHDADGLGVFWSIKCHECMASAGERLISNGNDCPQSRQEVRDAWNRRSQAPAPQAPSSTQAEPVAFLFVNGFRGRLAMPLDLKLWEALPHGTKLYTSEVQSMWQPIETAPKDGSAVILSNGRSVSQGWWCHEEPYVRENRDLHGRYINQDEFDGFDGWMDVDGGMLPEPTHWMPLPPAPRQGPNGTGSGEE